MTTLLIKDRKVELVFDGEALEEILNRAAREYAKEKAEQDALNKCYTSEEMCERCRISRSTLERHVATGRIQGFPIGDADGQRVKMGFTEAEARRYTGDLRK